MPDIRPPAEIEWLVQLVGLEAAVRLVAEHGGTRVKVPALPRASSKLVLEIGLEAVRRLVETRGAGMWKVPALKRWRVSLLQAQGLSLRDIALRVRLDESTVSRYLKQPLRPRRGAPPAGQMTLPV